MTSNQAWLNAEPCDQSFALDRGLLYGDGFFTTMLCYQQRLLNWPAHAQRIAVAAQRLGFLPLDEVMLQRTLNVALLNAPPSLAVIKIVITRGVGGAGYAPAPVSNLNYFSYLIPAPAGLAEVVQQPQQCMPRLKCIQCQTPVSINSYLAGIKHLNRLENVLARHEVDQSDADDGLMFTGAGQLISGTQGNVVLIREGVAYTPKLHQAGVSGTCLNTLKTLPLGLNWLETELTRQDLVQAQAVFICNAVRGVQAVARFDEVSYDTKLIEPINQAWWAWLIDQSSK